MNSERKHTTGKLIVTEMVTVDGVAQAPYVNAEVENLMFAPGQREARATAGA